jgi:hypothetical protein
MTDPTRPMAEGVVRRVSVVGRRLPLPRSGPSDKGGGVVVHPREVLGAAVRWPR